MIGEVFKALADPIRLIIVLVNIVGWWMAYHYFKKVIDEWRSQQGTNLKKPTKIGKEVVPRSDRNIHRYVVVIGEPGAGKTTISRALGHALVRRNFVCRTGVGIPPIKTEGIRYYVFDKITTKADKSKTMGLLKDTIVIADFAGEIRSVISENKEKVVFNQQQIEELKKANVIIEVIWWKDDSTALQKVIQQYEAAIGRALGIIGRDKVFASNKEFYRVVTHLDEAGSLVPKNKDVKTKIQRLSSLPANLFTRTEIIPSNPKQFVEIYENDPTADPKQLEKNYGIDILVEALAGRRTQQRRKVGGEVQ